eukprot:7589850-Pyramimonas_sp.AAC.1
MPREKANRSPVFPVNKELGCVFSNGGSLLGVRHRTRVHYSLGKMIRGPLSPENYGGRNHVSPMLPGRNGQRSTKSPQEQSDAGPLYPWNSARGLAIP